MSVQTTNRPSENPYEGLALDHLFEIKETLKSEIAEINRMVRYAESEIEKRVTEAVTERRNKFEKETGRIETEVEGVVVIHDVPKRVEWLQTELAEIADELGAMGHDPHDIIATKLSVNENVYKSLPEKVQWLLNRARITKHGKTTITMKEPK